MKMQWTHRPLLLLAAMLFAVSAATPSFAAEPILIDGRFEDWGEVEPAAVDPAGDAEGAFDLRSVDLTSRGTDLFVRFRIGETVSLQSGPEEEGTLRLRVSRPDADAYIAVDFRGRKIALSRDGEQTRLRWPAVRYAIGPTHAADAFEIRLNLDRLGVQRGDRISVRFAGADQLDSPLTFELRETRPEKQFRSPERPDATDLRVVSFNVQRDGLTEDERREKIARLLRATDADVLCLQELYAPEAREIAGTLNGMMKANGGQGGKGGKWRVHKEDDCAIAARWPVVGVEADEYGYAAAVVKHPEQGPLLVLSTHIRCCGYKGSEEDQRRIEQAKAMAKTVRKVRNAEPGTDLHPYRNAPVILAGDMNLVGSTQPLESLAVEPAPGLKRWRLRTLDSRSVMSWVNPGSTFAPGTLDLMLYDPDGLKPLHGFILDSRRLNQALRDRLGLKPDDSDASDHLLLVGDFAVE